MIERAGDQMRPAAVESDRGARTPLCVERGTERRGRRAAHALRLSAGAAGVHHRAAGRAGEIERGIECGGERALEFVAGDDHVCRAGRPRSRSVLRIGDHQLRARVREHVRNLFRPQVAIHRRDPQPRGHRADHDFDGLDAIAHQNRDVRTGREREVVAQPVRDPPHAIFEFHPIAAACAVVQGEFVRRGFGARQDHARFPSNASVATAASAETSEPGSGTTTLLKNAE